jgi:hypothetical protein
MPVERLRDDRRRAGAPAAVIADNGSTDGTADLSPRRR